MPDVKPILLQERVANAEGITCAGLDPALAECLEILPAAPSRLALVERL